MHQPASSHSPAKRGLVLGCSVNGPIIIFKKTNGWPTDPLTLLKIRCRHTPRHRFPYVNVTVAYHSILQTQTTALRRQSFGDVTKPCLTTSHLSSKPFPITQPMCACAHTHTHTQTNKQTHRPLGVHRRRFGPRFDHGVEHSAVVEVLDPIKATNDVDLVANRHRAVVSAWTCTVWAVGERWW